MLLLKRFFQGDTPENYRETSFKFGHRGNMVVAGLARPDSGNQNPLVVMQYLKDHNVKTIFGLDASPKFIKIAALLELEYCDVSVPDFSAPDIGLYEKVFEKIMEQAEAGKRVAIHCRGGIGRTGTVLAAIKLKEMAQNDSFYACGDTKDCTIDLPYQTEPASCSKNVRDAILAIRAVSGSEDAVEVEDQIEGLCEYESFLRNSREKQHGHEEVSKIKTSSGP